MKTRSLGVQNASMSDAEAMKWDVVRIKSEKC